MGVVKLTSSARAVNFIDDEGNSFITSVSFLRSLLDSGNPQRILKLTRMPDKVSIERFGVSDVFNASVLGDESRQSKDAMAVVTRKEREVAKSYVDREVF